jgi:hypothetical protein
MMDRNISASGRFWIALFGFLLLMQCGLVAQTAPASKFVFPRFLSFEEQSTGIAIFNPSLQTASVTLTLRTWDGRLVTDVENPVTLFVPARGQVARTSGELFGSGQVIDAVLEITSATAGLAASYQTFDPGMTLLDGGIAPEASTALILPVIPSSAEGMSEIDFVNPNTREASVELKLWSFEGSLLGTATIQVPGGGNYRNLTDYVFPSGTSFSRASHITATSKPRNVLSGVQSVAATSLFAGFSSSAPVGGYVDLAGLNAVPLTRATTTGAIPYFHTGGHFASTLCLVNVEAASVNVSVTAIDNEGGTLGTRTVSIAAQGGLRQSLEGFLTALGSGEHEGWLLVQSSGRLAGAVVHGWSTAASLAAAPLQKSPKAEFVFPQVVESAGMLTEISLVNPSPSGASALIHLVAPDGTTLATGTLALGPNQRVSRTIHQLLPEVNDLPGGILHVEASGSLFATATIWTDTGSLASNLEPQDTSYLPAPLGTFAVTGRVTVNDQPAKDFVVVLSGAADRQTLTDEDGLYAFAHVVAGEYTLKVSQLGFQLLPPEVTFEITDTSVRQDFSGVTFGDAILVKPSYLPVGGNDATLSVFGNGFNAGSRAYAGGILLKTEYVNSSQLLAVLPAYMMAEPASFEVSVVTEESGISVVS